MSSRQHPQGLNRRDARLVCNCRCVVGHVVRSELKEIESLRSLYEVLERFNHTVGAECGGVSSMVVTIGYANNRTSGRTRAVHI